MSGDIEINVINS